jgi:hypothetical protein
MNDVVKTRPRVQPIRPTGPFVAPDEVLTLLMIILLRLPMYN